MRFLGIRNGHDANLTYTDGTKVTYHKLERNLQIKHYEWREEGANAGENPKDDDIETILRYAKDNMGVDFTSLDAICINPSMDRHALHTPFPWQLERKIGDPIKNRGEECIGGTEESVHYKLEQEWLNKFSCPVWVIDHHYAHVLSCWPLWKEMPRVNFVFDGIGDHARNASVFRDDKLVHAVHAAETPGLSVLFEHWGQQLGIKGMKIDLAGKLMAKAAYHTIPKEVEEEILFNTHYLFYTQIPLLKSRCEDFIDHFRNNEEGMINSAYILQEFCKRKIPEFMELYYPGRDKDWGCYFEPVTYSGGTAQNTVVNTAIKERFPNAIIPPHCPDDGISLGCVEYLRLRYGQEEPFEISGFPFWQSDEAPSERPSYATIWRAVEALASGKTVGWYQGHGEIGPRALGNRSILMDPTLKNGKETINRKVKHREPYRPFGASVLKEKVTDFFDFEYDSPFMLYVTNIKNRTRYPAVTHVDGTCRIQTVDGNDPAFEDYHRLLEAYQKVTGCPMLLNTSLNVDGKPIAAHLSDARTLFENSELDMLVVGDEVVTK